MITAICVVLVVLVVLSFSIIAEAKLIVDIYGKANSISFFLFGIKVFGVDIDFIRSQSDFVKLELKNKKRLVATLSLDQIDSNSARDTFRQALPNPFYNLDIIEIDCYAEYGGENAFGTAMTVGVLRYLLADALVRLRSKQKIKTTSFVQANFDARTIIFKLNSIFCVTLADIIYGIIFSKKGEKKNDIGK